MKKTILIILLFFLVIDTKGQRRDTTIYAKCGPKPKGVMITCDCHKNDSPNADECPTFPGGWKKANLYLIRTPNHIKKQGDLKVFVKVVIEKDGSINHVQIMHSANPKFNSETIRIFRSLPKWKPARVKNHPVRSYYYLYAEFGP